MLLLLHVLDTLQTWRCLGMLEKDKKFCKSAFKGALAHNRKQSPLLTQEPTHCRKESILTLRLEQLQPLVVRFFQRAENCTMRLQKQQNICFQKSHVQPTLLVRMEDEQLDFLALIFTQNFRFSKEETWTIFWLLKAK